MDFSSREDIEFDRLKEAATKVKQVSQIEGVAVLGPGAELIEQYLNQKDEPEKAKTVESMNKASFHKPLLSKPFIYKSYLDRDLDKNVTISISISLGDREAEEAREIDAELSKIIKMKLG